MQNKSFREAESTPALLHRLESCEKVYRFKQVAPPLPMYSMVMRGISDTFATCCKMWPIRPRLPLERANGQTLHDTALQKEIGKNDG